MEKLKELLAALGLSAATDRRTLLAELNTQPIALYNAETGEFAKWLPLIVPDENNMLKTTKGNWPVNQQSIIANYKARGIDMVIDYEHQSLGSKDGNPIPAPASGWIQDMTDAYGILFILVDWTPRAREYITNKEYKYLSPSIGTDESGVVVMVYNVGLTNNPATLNAIPITLSASGDYIYAAGGGKEENIMERATLIAMLGLSASATDADITAAIQALRDGHTRAATALSLSANASPAEIEGKITALSANSTQLEVVQTELNKIKLESQKKEAEGLVTEALTAGKITPAQETWAKEYALSSPDGFKAFVANAQPVVPTGDGLKPDTRKDGVVALSAVDKEVMKNLGVSEEDMKQYGGAQ